MIREILTCIFLLLGGILSIVAAAGVLRMPDLFIRMHAATKVGTVGVSSIAIGQTVRVSWPEGSRLDANARIKSEAKRS